VELLIEIKTRKIIRYYLNYVENLLRRLHVVLRYLENFSGQFMAICNILQDVL
jgi:hypothetical protein